ncbi:thermonuclease family protein [Magnetospirillum sp. UT-4]|uniref:thermonuclease family protein n=1 Tax=Magnetospirillum sp. UT-4 TaxID=2681467 RepID=UPI0020C21041|nr:thermonuclease family protein [Magnetospirillum sp. UT-4]
MLPGPVLARVVKVVDGDTVAVRARIWLGQDVETNVRILGIDTPETRGRCERERDLARQAKDFVTARLVVDDVITLNDVTHDKYGKRVVARVVTGGGEDIGAGLISAGLARAYGGATKTGWCPG